MTMIIDVITIESQIVQDELVMNAEWFCIAFFGLILATVFWSVYLKWKEINTKRKLKSELCH